MNVLYQKQEYTKNHSKKNILSSWHPSTRLLWPRMILPLLLNKTIMMSTFNKLRLLYHVNSFVIH